jgi:hypothetical protein
MRSDRFDIQDDRSPRLTWGKPKPEPKPRKVWIIVKNDGWIWDGIHPWVKSSGLRRDTGVTFPLQSQAIQVRNQLKAILSNGSILRVVAV